MDKCCPYCQSAWTVSKGPNRVVGPIARSCLGVFAPIPDDFEYEFCPKCEKRNLTDETVAALLGFEKQYLAAP